MRSGGWIGLVVALGALFVAAPASAAELLSQTVSAASAVDKSCTGAERSGAGVAQKQVIMPSAGAVTARLTAASGDWDLAVIDATSGRVVAGSAYSGSSELASGYAVKGSELVVQACRLTGSASTAKLSLDSTAIDTSHTGKVQLVRVSTPTLARKNALNRLGLDVTEHGGPGFVEVVLYGADDAQKLVANNFAYTLEVPDMSVQARQDRAADAKFAAADATSEFPSGRTSYRRLFDYSQDMKRLAREHPDLVRPITLNHNDLRGPPGRGHRDRDEPERPRRPSRVPPDGRAPRA